MPYNAGMQLQNFKSVISILAIGIFLTLYVNYQSYITYKKQIPLMADFNYGKYTINVEEYEKFSYNLKRSYLFLLFSAYLILKVCMMCVCSL